MSSSQPQTLPNLEKVKREAKQLKKATPDLKHARALDIIAKSHGFNNYTALQRAVTRGAA